jgi:PiT family inorganic phosphate transporter
MLEPTTILTLLVAAGASAFMAWTIGAGSSGATPFAPAVGANAISILRAAFVVGLLGFIGAVTQGANVSEAVGSGLVANVSLTPMAVILALLTAAGLMLVGIQTGIPIATAFTVTGSVIGIGLALGGDPVWSKYLVVGGMWVLTPFVGGGVAYSLARTLAHEDVPEEFSIPLVAGVVGVVVANVNFSFLGPAGTSQSPSVAGATHLPLSPLLGRVAVTLGIGVLVTGVVAWYIRRDEEATLRGVLLGLGSLVAFSAGGSQVGLAVGPLIPLLDVVDIPMWAVLVGGGLGLLVGSWTGAPRMIQSLSQEYSSLGPRRSISALVPSFAIAQAAVLLGVPVSFNEIIVSAIIGSGLAVGGSAGVSRSKLLRTVGAWIGSFVLAFAVGYGAFSLVGRV